MATKTAPTPRPKSTDLDVFHGARAFAELCERAGFDVDRVETILESWLRPYIERMLRGRAPFVGGYFGECRRMAAAFKAAGVDVEAKALWAMFDDDRKKRNQ